MKQWGKYIALFFLLGFAFPQIEKELHAIHHEEQFSCDVNGEQHLHELHHDCTLCDFVIPATSAPSLFRASFFQPSFAQYIFRNPSEIYLFSSQFALALLRAPPAIS